MPLDIRLWSSSPSPAAGLVTMLVTPAEALSLELPVTDGAPVLETPVLSPIDLTDTHGVDFTLPRLEEIVAAYDPAIETATLTFDHAYGGPTHGRCESLWLANGVMFCRYVDLSTDAVEGIRQRRWTRRSGEFLVNHPVTNGFYFTGLALLGKSRPAVPGLPPLQEGLKMGGGIQRLHHRPFFIFQKEQPAMAVPSPDPAPASPPAQPAQPPAVAAEAPATVQLAAELEQLRAGVALVSQLRRQNAELQAEKNIQQLGARVTPAMRRTLQPLLTHLMAQEAPQTIKLSHSEGGQTVEKEIAVADAILQILSAVPSFEALNLGELANEDGPPADIRPADVVALHGSHGLTSDRYSQLQSKYRF
jgi:pyruvate/2-oxoglutarate dehydrogenase complex dihydrolipoamide acyltransferase (E2) component